jgi:hypothetical protein
VDLPPDEMALAVAGASDACPAAARLRDWLAAQRGGDTTAVALTQAARKAVAGREDRLHVLADSAEPWMTGEAGLYRSVATGDKAGPTWKA